MVRDAPVSLLGFQQALTHNLLLLQEQTPPPCRAHQHGILVLSTAGGGFSQPVPIPLSSPHNPGGQLTAIPHQNPLWDTPMGEHQPIPQPPLRIMATCQLSVPILVQHLNLPQDVWMSEQQLVTSQPPLQVTATCHPLVSAPGTQEFTDSSCNTHA